MKGVWQRNIDRFDFGVGKQMFVSAIRFRNAGLGGGGLSFAGVPAGDG